MAPWSDVVSGTTNAVSTPGDFTSLTATASSPSIIDLSWTAGDDGGSPITGYEISVRILSPFMQILSDTAGSSATSYRITGLTASTTYLVVVRAKNIIGINPNTSQDSRQITTTAGAPPGLPTGFTATASGRTTINLSWAAPTNTGGLPITGYELQYSQNKTPRQWIQLGGGSIIGTSYAHRRRGRSASTTDHYRLRVSNNRGSSAWTSSVNATTDPAVVPGPPRGI